MTVIPESEWKNLNTGELCGKNEYGFGRQTRVGNYVVSTIGEWGQAEPFDLFGSGSFYETRVFLEPEHAGSTSPLGADKPICEVFPYDSREKAEAGHLKACQKYARARSGKKGALMNKLKKLLGWSGIIALEVAITISVLLVINMDPEPQKYQAMDQEQVENLLLLAGIGVFTIVAYACTRMICGSIEQRNNRSGS